MCTAFIICIQFVFSRDIFALLQQLNKSSQPWQTQSSHWTMYTCTTIQQPVAVPPSLWLCCRTRDTLIFKKWHRKIRHSLLQYHKIRYIVTSLLFRLDRRGKSSKTSNWWAVTRSFPLTDIVLCARIIKNIYMPVFSYVQVLRPNKFHRGALYPRFEPTALENWFGDQLPWQRPKLWGTVGQPWIIQYVYSTLQSVKTCHEPQPEHRSDTTLSSSPMLSFSPSHLPLTPT